jgi:hypothetical protein
MGPPHHPAQQEAVSVSTVLLRTVLGPCTRPGNRISAGHKFDDWWREPHVSCTGSHSVSADEIVECSCLCHSTEPHLRCPRTYDERARCVCGNAVLHAQQSAALDRVEADMRAAGFAPQHAPVDTDQAAAPASKKRPSMHESQERDA